MSEKPLQAVNVEEVVRQVLARLAGDAALKTSGQCACRGSGPAASHTHGPCQCPDKQTGLSGATKLNAPPPASPAALVWNDRVLTVGDLKGRLGGLRRLAVGPRTIVTPAASDLLREAKVELTRGDATGLSLQAGSLIVATAGTDFCTEGLRKHLSQRGIETVRVPRGGLIEATRATIEQVASTSLPALLLTCDALAAVCLANRHRAIRAAAVRTVDEARQARAQVGANVVVVDPIRRPAAELQRIARELATEAAACPTELAAALN